MKIDYSTFAYNEKLYAKELSQQYERSLSEEKKQSLKLKEAYPTAKQLFKDRYMVNFLCICIACC